MCKLIQEVLQFHLCMRLIAFIVVFGYGMFNLILLHVRVAFITPSLKSRNVSLDQEFPWPRGLCLAEAAKQEPSGYGKGQSGELWNFIKLALFVYATLLREECSICVVTLHGSPAETWLVACEAALLQGSVHKMEKSSSFISLVKTKLEISFHFAFSSWRGGWYLFYSWGSSQNQLCREGPGQRNPGLSVLTVKSLQPGPDKSLWGIEGSVDTLNETKYE